MLKRTPQIARIYIFLAAFFLAVPAINKTMYPSLAGRLLVAPAGSAVPFDDAVIYIVHHDLFSAHGVIINKPMPDVPLIGGQVPYNGGPVDPAQVVEYHAVTGAMHPYVGYSGWGPVQLDYEVFRRAWHVTDADADILDAPPDTMWGRAIDKIRAAQPGANPGLL